MCFSLQQKVKINAVPVKKDNSSKIDRLVFNILGGGIPLLIWYSHIELQ